MCHEGRNMPTPTTPPSKVRRALRTLGSDIQDARKRRALSMETVADRAFTSRKTLQRIEQGDHGVSVGIYASVLNALGLLDGLAALADPVNDKIGMELASANLPQRVRSKKPRINQQRVRSKKVAPKKDGNDKDGSDNK